jgi:hypothetical protein
MARKETMFISDTDYNNIAANETKKIEKCTEKVNKLKKLGKGIPRLARLHPKSQTRKNSNYEAVSPFRESLHR